MKELLKRFHLNGNTIRFYPQTQKLELHTKYIVPCESTQSAEEVSLNRNIIVFIPQTQKLESYYETLSFILNELISPIRIFNRTETELN